MRPGLCTFCDIAAGREPARIRYENERILVFDNKLDWMPVMLLLIPKQHMAQDELWRSGELMAEIAALAVRLGQQYCPSGFRILSNFGHDAMQSQPHAHVHVIGGAPLGLYVRRPGFGFF